MFKNYIEWMILKRIVESVDIRPLFQERDIWYAYVGESIGHEQDGAEPDFVRPVVIFRKFDENQCWVIPLTRTIRKGPFYFNFIFRRGELNSALLVQLSLIDAKRLVEKIGFINNDDFRQLKEKLKELLP